jgi:glutathione peroxidase
MVLPFRWRQKRSLAHTNAHPFHNWTTNARPNDVPRWNFRKYLIGRDGYIAEVYFEMVEALDTRLKTAIARSLAAT